MEDGKIKDPTILELDKGSLGGEKKLAWRHPTGGRQQMLAMGRALMARPKLLFYDEPSMDLAPLMVAGIFKDIHEINREGATVPFGGTKAKHGSMDF